MWFFLLTTLSFAKEFIPVGPARVKRSVIALPPWQIERPEDLERCFGQDVIPGGAPPWNRPANTVRAAKRSGRPSRCGVERTAGR